MTVHAQTPYKTFKNARAWNEWLRLPIDYALLPLNAQLAITVWDLSPAGPHGARGHHIPFGGTTISLFDEDGTLRKGRQKCRLWRHKQADAFTDSTTPWTTETKSRRRNQEKKPVFADDKHSQRAAELERLQGVLKRHEMGEIAEHKWLDQMVFRQIERMERANIRDDSKIHAQPNGNPLGDQQDEASGIFYLYIEFPRFDHPVVFTDHEYPPPPVSSARLRTLPGSDVRLKPPADIHPGPNIDPKNPGYGDSYAPHLIRIYDPEVGFYDNPAEIKHRSLVRNQRIGMLDRHLKPNPKTRDQLNHILSYGPTTDLSPEEKDKIFKFRHYLSRDKRALTKLIKSTSWIDSNEVRQVIQLLPKWEEIDIDDALELLGPSFDNKEVRAYAVDRLRKADDEVQLAQITPNLHVANMSSRSFCYTCYSWSKP